MNRFKLRVLDPIWPMRNRRCMVTELLKQAFDELAKLPDFEQDALAEMLLSAVSADKHWDAVLAHTQDKLARLADRALEVEERDLEPLDPDKL